MGVEGVGGLLDLVQREGDAFLGADGRHAPVHLLDVLPPPNFFS
jgi:hypothetical protein